MATIIELQGNLTDENSIKSFKDFLTIKLQSQYPGTIARVDNKGKIFFAGNKTVFEGEDLVWLNRIIEAYFKKNKQWSRNVEWSISN